MAAEGNAPVEWDRIKQRSFLETVLFTVVPAAGGVSYEIFSANITNPKQFIKLFSPYELIVANGLWFNSHLGVGLFIYSRQHIIRTSWPYRVLYSTLGSVVFNFGSVLLWATVKGLLPPNPPIRVAVGAISGLIFLLLGYSYFNFVDSLCVKSMHVNGRLRNLADEVD